MLLKSLIETSRVWRLAAIALLFSGCISGCSGLPNSYKGRLADHLTETGAKMYGAYWCPHCATQKDYFDGVVGRIPYIECDPNGYDPQPDLCAAAGIEAYPTWVIDGKYYLGAKPLGKLAALSGFESEDEPPAFEGSSDAEGAYSPAK